ncbi:MAG: UDP-N-acetylmuramoyl-tripeptide--D-alanyl-D-alanine ligase [Clostridiales bacterium]|nr:UDP-N-acetylmuramoyl-tripeptide--D-alanyl-D-alanine ligase [Clostridiales bacterium]
MIYALAVALACVLASRGLIHYFQLESYQFPGYYRTLKRNWKNALLPGAILGLVLISLGLVKGMAGDGLVVNALAGAGILALGVFLCWISSKQKAKKALVFTPRVKRLYAVAAVVFALICCLLPHKGLFLFAFLLPVWVALAGLLAWPIEKLISEMYFRDAQRKLKARPDLIRIGITGSYGKTSVKFILGTLLSEKYQTLVTPSSFNTPMGVTKIIRTKLQPAHQVFVAEMGARHVGDIKEMCRLVHPTYGVLTSVGPQHLDTFKTLERIKKTKYELMDAIPQEGCCFFPDDGAICRELYDKTAKTRRLCCFNENGEADVWAKDVTVSPAGSRFELCTREGSIVCETKLLGEHNIQNILLAATVCLHLGLTLRQISRGIARLSPVEHRLQLIPSPGVTIIDDAFNSNPKGAEAALKVIRDFPGRRIIITPGMVELGEGEDEFNREFGRKMADCVDVAILVGVKHTQPIADGLKEAGFAAENIRPVKSLDEAAALLRQIGRPGDVALFENDLPDNYSEQ